MANAIDLIVSKNAVAELQKTYELLGKTHDEILKISKVQIDFNGGSSPKNPAQMQKVIADFNKLEQASNRATAQLVKNKERERLAEIKLAQDREKAFVKYEQQLNKEQQKLNAAQNLYNKTQQQLNLVQAAYNNLATKKERYNNLTAQEEMRLNTLQRVSERYNTTLKAVDATVGKHTRNVGNYAGSFNPLSNSINQLSREMPAFANSVQTGFMAISNNLPIFFDAMQQATAQQKELQKQGKPTQNALQLLAGSIFTVGTALSVGVTLLTLYGAEMYKFMTTTNAVARSLGEVEKAQDSYNNAKSKGVADSQNEMIALRQLMNIAKDEKRTMDERNLAIKLMRDQYPYFLKQISDQEILTGKATRAENELTKAIDANAQAQNKQASLNTTRERISQIDAEIQARQKYQSELKSLMNSINESDKTNQLSNFRNAQQKAEFIKMTNEEIAALKLSEKERQKRRDGLDDDVLSTGNLNTLTAEKNRLEKETIFLQQYVNKNVADALLLRWKEEKERKERKKSIKELSFAEIRSIYELRKATIELQIAERAGRMNNEENLLNDRIAARKEFSEKTIELLDLEIKYERDVLMIKYKEDLKQNNQAFKEREISFAKFQKNVQDIQNRYNNEIEKTNVEASLKWQENLKADQEFYKKLELEKRKFNEDTQRLILESEKNKFKKVSDNERKTLKIRQEAFREYLKLSRQELDIAKIRELANANSDEEISNIIQKYKGLNAALEAQESPWQKARQGFEDYLHSLGSGFLDKTLNDIGLSSLKVFMDIDKNGETTFMKLMELAETTGEAIAVSFQNIGDVFQDVVNIMNEASQKQYERDIARLESQRDLSIQFAGESTTAREAIERQYEERRRQLERRKAEEAKRNAIFNLIIDTAQAVVGALAEQNYVGAALFAALGAAQIALVSSTPVPAYAEGTENHSGGAMLINDGKGSNYTETVQTPDGKLRQYKGRNVMVNAPKGTKVFNHDQWQDKLNGILSENNILYNRNFDAPIINSSGITESEFNAGISKLANVIQSKESITLVRDEKGERIYKKVQGQRQQILNARLNIKGYEV